MRITSQVSAAIILTGLLLTTAAASRAAEQQYNFSFELTNASGADLFADGSFFADPTTATTTRGADGVGELYSTQADSLAFTVFDFGSSQNVGTVNLGKSNLQNTGLVYYKSFNPASGLGDPIFALSAPDATGFLTLLLNGSTDSFYQESTLGSPAGTAIVSGPAVVAQSLDATLVPEPASLGMAGGVLLLLGFARRLRRV